MVHVEQGGCLLQCGCACCTEPKLFVVTRKGSHVSIATEIALICLRTVVMHDSTCLVSRIIRHRLPEAGLHDILMGMPDLRAGWGCVLPRWHAYHISADRTCCCLPRSCQLLQEGRLLHILLQLVVQVLSSLLGPEGSLQPALRSLSMAYFLQAIPASRRALSRRAMGVMSACCAVSNTDL